MVKLSKKQLAICDRLAEAISEERCSGWEEYPSLNKDLHDNFAYKYREIESVKRIIGDEQRHSRDLLAIYNRLCKGRK